MEFLEQKIELNRTLKPPDVLFIQDESSFYLNGIPHKMFARKGTRPILQMKGSKERINVSGIIDPINDKAYFALIPRLNAKIFEQFLRGLIKRYPGPDKIYMILDNASTHHTKALQPLLESVRDKLELIFLPPYSPDLSEIEQLWHLLKEEVVYNSFYPTFNDFKGALVRALK